MMDLLWSFFVAATLGSLWYFSEYGPAVTHYILGLLCYLSTPLLRNAGRESGTQTDEVSEENVVQGIPAEEGLVGSDSPDGGNTQQSLIPQDDVSLDTQYPHVKKSLAQVFECAYSQLVLSWYSPPEACDSQPLYQALYKEFDSVVDQVIKSANDFDLREAVVGCIRILTQHLHNAKQPDREPLFGSRAEEMAVLRVFSEALVRNLFPKSLWGLDVNRCALNEIVALKALEHLVTWLSDPDNLNQLVVGQLDRATPKSTAEELCPSDSERASSASQEEGEGAEGSEVISGSSEETSHSNSRRKRLKRRSNKLKEGWSKLMEKVKSKKHRKKSKKKEQELMFRALANHDDRANEDTRSSGDSSARSQPDSDDEDSDLEAFLTSVQEDMMEFKLSYEMWRVSHWAVRIPQMEVENEELVFTVHLEERDNPENLNWDIKKSHTEVVYFRNRWQNSTNLPSICILEQITESLVSDEVREEARASAEHFLQELVLDELIGHTQPVFQFLCPLEKLLSEEENYGGVWGLLSGLAYFLTPGQEEEEHCSPNVENEDVSSSPPEPTALSGETFGSTVPTVCIANCDPHLEPSEETSEKKTQSPGRSDSNLSEENSRGGQSCCHGKSESSENPLASHFKLLIRGKSWSRSQESLASTKEACDENQERCLVEDGSEGLSWHFGSGSNRKEKLCLKLSCGFQRNKGKDESTLPKDDDSQKSHGRWERLEPTKAVFDLLKEIAGNSILLNIFDAMLKPVMPILKKKVSSFFGKIHPTEAQMASYIDNLCEALWPQGAPPPPPPPHPPVPPRTGEEKQETREKAHQLINAKYSNYLILKKTDVENVFRYFQDVEENKKLVYMLLSFLLRGFLPDEDALNVSAMALQRVNGHCK